MSATRVTAVFVVFITFSMLAPLLSRAAEDTCDAASKIAVGKVTNDCKVCVTTATGGKKLVGASCTVRGGGGKTTANCAANPKAPPGTCVTKYCVGKRCFNAQVKTKPKEGAPGLKDVNDLYKLRKELSLQTASGDTPIKLNPTPALDSALEEPISQKEAYGRAAQQSDVERKLPDADIPEIMKVARVIAENPEINKEIMEIMKNNNPKWAFDPQDTNQLDGTPPGIVVQGDKNTPDLKIFNDDNTFPEPQYLEGRGSCTGLWDCTLAMAKEGFQDFFSGDQRSQEEGKAKEAGEKTPTRASCYGTWDCGDNPAWKDSYTDTRDKIFNPEKDYIAAVGKGSPYKYGDRIKVVNPESGTSVIATVRDYCPGCGAGKVDLTGAAARQLGFDKQLGIIGVRVQREPVAPLIATRIWNGSIANTPSRLTIATGDFARYLNLR